MVNFFNSIWTFILSIPDEISAAFNYLVIKLKIAFYELAESFVTFASDTFTSFMNGSTFLSSFEGTYLGLSQDIRFALEALNIPQAIIILMSAYALRFVIKLIPLI